MSDPYPVQKTDHQLRRARSLHHDMTIDRPTFKPISTASTQISEPLNFVLYFFQRLMEVRQSVGWIYDNMCKTTVRVRDDQSLRHVSKQFFQITYNRMPSTNNLVNSN